jgi:hypothetical protein
MASRWVLGGFAVLLIAVGVLGFLPAGGRGSTSNAPAYNVFHLAFGVAGLAFAVWGDRSAARAFLVGFGLIDLYQALASHQHWVPEALFRWTPTDDLLHLVVGVMLIAAGAFL